MIEYDDRLCKALSDIYTKHDCEEIFSTESPQAWRIWTDMVNKDMKVYMSINKLYNRTIVRWAETQVLNYVEFVRAWEAFHKGE